ncbi:MAG: prephenate dehydratase [Hyphomicrobiales bacterium]|nr:prephenate dehydratase [Hyphomicrobiales bacterium]
MNKDQRTGRIAFQGEPGANSDTASREKYPGMTPVPCDTFEDVFNALETGSVDLAMIPIENSLAGRVADIHHLMPHSNSYIIDEYFLPIHFQLMARKGITIESIRTVYSHIHALGQCRNIIREHNWKAIVGGDTAGSARMVSEQDDMSVAALAPELAAQLYDLEILATNVEDEDHNTTRFIILSHEEVRADQGSGDVITSFIFQVRNIPAALYKAMGGFATNKVNMTKLESYQIGGNFVATQFYADIEGHPDDRNVQLALEELHFFCEDLRILGVYPASAFRTN